ncbi:MAG: META domain-containing protein [Tannerella sp.]|jgi:heat shock protein HslJ|nr:META domain-containing protein [Tannerella sp.]
MKRKMLILGLVAFLTGLVACSARKVTEGTVTSPAASAGAKEPAEKELAGTYWKLVELSGESVTATPGPDAEPHLIFKAEGRSVYGSGGCNSFRGTYELKPENGIRFSPMISTLKMCVNNIETENKLMKALQTAEHYELKGDTLSLGKAGDAVPPARFEAVQK